MATVIRTRYVSHPGSNVGDIRATVHGARALVRYDQSKGTEQNHRAAAEKLAGRLGLILTGESRATDTGYVHPADARGNGPADSPADAGGYSVGPHRTPAGYPAPAAPAAPWSTDEARELRATARRMFADHGHGSYWDRMTREACGTCALNGYLDRETSRENDAPVQPNYAGWARLYVQAGRPIPAKYLDGFRAELADENTRYADALRRDIATFGVVNL